MLALPINLGMAKAPATVDSPEKNPYMYVQIEEFKYAVLTQKFVFGLQYHQTQDGGGLVKNTIEYKVVMCGPDDLDFVTYYLSYLLSS